MNRLSVLIPVGAALGVAACGAVPGSPTEETSEGLDVAKSTAEATAPAPEASLLVSADFSSTSTTKAILTNEISYDSAVKLLAVGDLSYTAPYADNYPWASWLSRTFPVAGNHEFDSVAGLGGEELYDLFNGDNAAENLQFSAITGANGVSTYDFSYSYEVAPGWLLVVENTGTNCDQQLCTTQGAALETTISNWRAANGGHGCVIVAMHTARWSTMFSSDADNLPWASGVDPIWKAAIASSADLVLQGHVHVYEEFVKLGAKGGNNAAGAKLFTIGAGGRGQVQPPKSNISSEYLVASHAAPINGVLKLALYDGAYGYLFETAATKTSPASSVACNKP